MKPIRYTIGLTPVTKKNSQRILHKGNRPFIAPSANYVAYEQAAGMFLRPRPMKPIEEPVEVCCTFYMPTKRRVDLTNLEEAVDDILVKHGILQDDHSGILVSHDGSRVRLDRERPRTEIEIREMEGEK